VENESLKGKWVDRNIPQNYYQQMQVKGVLSIPLRKGKSLMKGMTEISRDRGERRISKEGGLIFISIY
jgi:hypothetical protein